MLQRHSWQYTATQLNSCSDSARAAAVWQTDTDGLEQSVAIDFSLASSAVQLQASGSCRTWLPIYQTGRHHISKDLRFDVHLSDEPYGRLLLTLPVFLCT
jgi:hypothetical protein